MFDKIIGNEEIQELLKQTIKSKRASHSYLFIGTEGIGKKMLAKEFAKALLCIEENKYCGKCKSCIEFDNNNNPDFILIEPEESSIKIDQIREIQRKVVEKPIISRQKVYIIDDSDKMTPEAQNGLLKTLEEPPEYITIILIGSNENSFLSTIKSRCTILRFKDIKQEKIEKYLEEQGIYFKDKKILKACSGSIGKALQVKDKQEEYEIEIEKVYTSTNRSNKNMIIKVTDPRLLDNSKEEIQNILQYINILLLELAKENYKYAECVEIVENTKKRLQSYSNYDMTIDNMLMQIKEKIKQ